MIKKLVLFLMSVAVLFTLFVGCGEDKNLDGTTGGDVPQATTEQTDPIIATETDATIPGGQVVTYPEFESMTGEQQKEVISKFESKEDFNNWYEEIRDDYIDFVQSTKPSQNENSNATTELTENDGPIFPEATDVTIENIESITYQMFIDMTANEQKAFINTFATYDEFVIWYNAALQEHKDSMIEIVGTGPLNVGG